MGAVDTKLAAWIYIDIFQVLSVKRKGKKVWELSAMRLPHKTIYTYMLVCPALPVDLVPGQIVMAARTGSDTYRTPVITIGDWEEKQ